MHGKETNNKKVLIRFALVSCAELIVDDSHFIIVLLDALVFQIVYCDLLPASLYAKHF